MAVYRAPNKSLTMRTPRRAIQRSADKLAYERVVCLPFDLATVHGAAQNFRLDVAKGIHRTYAIWADMAEDYCEEALGHIQTHGTNLYPGDNDEPWIQIVTTAQVTMPSKRAQNLAEIFTLFFERNDPALFTHAHFPKPDMDHTNYAVETWLGKVKQLFEYH